MGKKSSSSSSPKKSGKGGGGGGGGGNHGQQHSKRQTSSSSSKKSGKEKRRHRHPSSFSADGGGGGGGGGGWKVGLTIATFLTIIASYFWYYTQHAEGGALQQQEGQTKRHQDDVSSSSMAQQSQPSSLSPQASSATTNQQQQQQQQQQSPPPKKRVRWPDTKIERLVDWITTNGGSIDLRISIKEDNGPSSGLRRGRGVYVDGKVEQKNQDELFSVPETCYFSPKTIYSSDNKAISGLVSVLDDPTLAPYIKNNEYVTLAIALLAERNAGSDSFWYPWIDALPTKLEEEQPIFWSDVDKNEFQSTLVIDKLKLHQQYFASESYMTMLQYLTTQYPDLYPEDKTTVYDFSWAYYIIMSRSFDVGRPASFELGTDEEYMTGCIPFVDMLNHVFDDVNATTIHSGVVSMPRNILFYVGMAAQPTLIRGTELNWRYTSYDASTKFLYRYGMMNPDLNNVQGDFIILQMNDISWPVNGNGHIDQAIFFGGGTTATTTVEGKKQSMIDKLVTVITKEIRTLPTSLEEDMDLLSTTTTTKDNPKKKKKKLLALIVRIRYKLILTKLVKWLDDGAPPPLAKVLIDKNGNDNVVEIIHRGEVVPNSALYKITI